MDVWKYSLGAHCLIHSKYRRNPKSETLKEHMQWLHKWHHYGAAKIAVKVDKTQMDFFQTEAKKRGLPTYRVIDAGRTQIERGTATVLGKFSFIILEINSNFINLYYTI